MISRPATVAGEVDLAARLRAVFGIEPTADAIAFDNEWWTWAQLKNIGDRLRLITTDLAPPHAPLAIVARNHPAVAAAIIGCLTERRPYVSMNPMLPDRALIDDLTDVRPAVLVLEERDLSRPALLEVASDSVPLIVCLSGRPGEPAEVVRHSPGWRHPGLPPDQATAVSILTSGTTGRAKRIVLRAADLLAAIDASQIHAGVSTSDKPTLRSQTVIVSGPLAHISGLFGALVAFTHGRKIALMERFEPEEWARLVQRHGVAFGAIPPAALQMVIDVEIPPEVLASLRAISTGTAPLPTELAEQFECRYGIPILQSYGATEFVGVASMTMADRRRWGDAKRGTSGRVHPDCEVQIIGMDDGRPLPTGHKGIIQVRRRRLDSRATTSWIRTNDVGTIDGDGFLSVHGRVDDIIIRGGFKVDLTRVQQLLMDHPSVREASVVGLPHDRLGSVPAAAVVVGETSVKPADLQTWIHDRRPAYEVPTMVLIVPALPRNPTLKVSRPEVVELLLAERARRLGVTD